MRPTSFTRTRRPPCGGLILDDDLGELGGVVEARQDVDRILERLILRRWRHADLAGGDLLALLADGR